MFWISSGAKSGYLLLHGWNMAIFLTTRFQINSSIQVEGFTRGLRYGMVNFSTKMPEIFTLHFGYMVNVQNLLAFVASWLPLMPCYEI